MTWLMGPNLPKEIKLAQLLIEKDSGKGRQATPKNTKIEAQ